MQALRMAREDFAEPSDSRLYRRLAQVTGGDLAQPDVERLAGGDLSLLGQLSSTAQQSVAALIKPGSAGHGELEKIVGPTIDYLSVAFLDRARAASRSVVRIVDELRQPIGSGVMVSSTLLLTNHHVTESAQQALDQVVQFNYELGVDGAPTPITEFRLDPSTFFITSPENELDFALIAVGRQLSGTAQLSSFGYAALSSADDKHAIGDFVTVIEHPDGGYTQIALRENRVIGRGKKGVTLHYGADTLPGASGSPVFNDALELIALHHAGGKMNDDTLEDGSPVPDDSNEGIRTSAIASFLRTAADGLLAKQRTLVLMALDPPFRGPSLLAVGAAAPARDQPEARLRALGGDVPTAAVGGVVRSGNGWARVTIPIEVTVRSTDVVTSGEPGMVALTGAVYERNDAPDPDYKKRAGYDAAFLTVPLELPALTVAMTKKAVQPKNNDAGDLELRYLHFSSVLRSDRKLPFFTAVNIDGALSRGINRKTGEVEGLEGGEIWYEDPRAKGSQVGQKFYNDQPKQPHWIFDRGHMVRRLDPAWGSPALAKQAADDTFHFTNCCPQVWQFNEQARYWAGIEEYVLQNAKLTDQRVTVFSGPVFASNDPVLLSVHIPQQFWKIVCRVENGALRATGFVASQADMLKKALTQPEAFTGWSDLGNAAVYQKTIKAIETATGLRFGLAKGVDTAKAPHGGPEAMALPISSLADVQW